VIERHLLRRALNKNVIND